MCATDVWCSIYHIRSDLEANPYGSVYVTWMSQEKDTLKWLYSYTQTDSGNALWWGA